MILKHLFKVALRWSSEREIEGMSNKRFVKNHSISIDGKPDINISAAKAFKGDASLYNPEDLLLSSLASCHMMSYLYCCSLNGISIANYKDDAEAFLEVNDDGSGRIVKVILNPIVTVSDSNMIELALSLHEKASELCFIANSCNFPIVHHPRCFVL